MITVIFIQLFFFRPVIAETFGLNGCINKSPARAATNLCRTFPDATCFYTKRRPACILSLPDHIALRQQPCPPVCPFAQVGEDVWRHLGKMSEPKVKAAIDDKFKWVAKQMEKSGEGRPGQSYQPSNYAKDAPSSPGAQGAGSSPQRSSGLIPPGQHPRQVQLPLRNSPLMQEGQARCAANSRRSMWPEILRTKASQMLSHSGKLDAVLSYPNERKSTQLSQQTTELEVEEYGPFRQ